MVAVGPARCHFVTPKIAQSANESMHFSTLAFNIHTIYNADSLIEIRTLEVELDTTKAFGLR